MLKERAMRAALILGVLGVAWAAGCATAQNDLGPAVDAGPDGSGGHVGGSGGVGGGKGGTSGTGGTGGFGATGGLGGTGGFGGTSGLGGTSGDAGVDGDSGVGGDGFGACVTQQEIDSQGSGTQIGFCPNPFAGFGCAFGGCTSDGVNPGDIVCSPACVCAPLPPLCTDGGADADTDADADADADDGADADDSSVDASDAASD
jgi:hypothetical protein